MVTTQMREGLFFLLFVLFLIQTPVLGQEHHYPELCDRLGPIIMDVNEHPVNPERRLEENFSEPLTSKQYPPFTMQGGTISCDASWNFSVMGKGIGAHSLRSLDLDHDGKNEMIASAYFYGYFFYTIQYNPTRHTYEQNWVSPTYFYHISAIKCFDLNNDSIYEIVVGFVNGDVLIFDGSTRKVTSSFRVPAPYGIFDMEYGDTDNDGVPEFVFCDLMGIYFVDPVTHAIKSKLSKNGTYDLAIGDVDGDGKNELALSGGDIIEYNGANATLEWTYDAAASPGGQIELSDIDQDGILEVIKADPDSSIHVYDADLKLQKYAIATQHMLDAMTICDVNNDGVDEILYGDAQWGELHCYNAATHTQMWSITNNNYGFSGICVGDGDHDGNLEVMWGSGQSANKGDTLYVYDLTTKAQEWKSKALDGPFFAFRIADVDNDSDLEIVTASASSANGSGGSIITVFNAITHDIEWQSDAQILPDTLMKVYDLEVADIDKDSINEIIVAANVNQFGAIWIIDGSTKAVKSSHIYSVESLGEFFTLDVADADGDGMLDIIAVNDQLRVIDPNTFAVKWSYSLPPHGYSAKVMVDNVDGDSNPEIVVIINPNIYMFDGVTHQSAQITSGTMLNCFDLFDMDGDHVKEIISGTSYGTISINNNVTKQVTQLGRVCPYYIDGIHVTYLNNDTIPEILFTSQNVLYFRTSNTVISKISLANTGQAGPDDALQTIDVDNDGNQEIFVGTMNRMYEFGGVCNKCLWFGINVNETNVSCMSNHDGSIRVNTVGGTAPYIFKWSTGSTDSLLQNLLIGSYGYTVSEQGGCSIIDSVIVQKAPAVYMGASQYNIECLHPNQGSITAYGYSGTPPFHYQWSTGDTSATITGLSTGPYTVVVSDAAYCFVQRHFTVTTQSITVNSQKQNIHCTGENNGSISANIYGQAPFTFQWSNGATGPSITDLQAGIYTLLASDSRGCVHTDTFVIMDPLPITVSVSTSPDDLSKAGNDGTALAVASGGTPPYYFNWRDPLLQSDSSAILLAGGNYMLIVHDAFNCRDTVTVSVGTTSSDVYVFPNPPSDHIVIRVNNTAPALLTIRNSLGQDMIDPTEFIRETKVNTSDFSMGTYMIYIEQGEETQVKKIVLSKKP